MRHSLCFFAVYSVLVPCFSEDAMHSSCASDDDGDDRCEFIQSGVGLVSQHQPEAAHTQERVAEKREGAGFGKHDKQIEMIEKIEHTTGGRGWPDLFKGISKIISGSSDLKEDAKNFKEEVETFATTVTETTTDLLQKVTSAKTLKEVTTQVDAAGHKIWLALKSVLDALAKIGTDFNTGVGKALPTTTFTDYLEAAIAKIKAEGNSLEELIDIKLSVLGNTSICTEAEKRIESLNNKVAKFVESMSGLTPDGIKEEVDKLFKLLPENAQEEINKFLTQITDSASSFIDVATNAGKEIYGSFGKALKGYCPNFASFESLAAPSKVGIFTALAVSAAALTL